MKLLRLALVLLLSGLVWVAGGGHVSACSCAEVEPEVSFAQASDVFVGRVESVDDTGEFQAPFEVLYVTHVEGVFKGEAFATLCLGNQPIGLAAATSDLGRVVGEAGEPLSSIDPAVIEIEAAEVVTDDPLIPGWAWGLGFVLFAGGLAIAGIVLGRRASRADIGPDGPGSDKID